MIYQYVVVIKSHHNRYIDFLGILLSLVSVTFFAYELLNADKVGLAYLLGAIFVMAVVAWNIYQSARKKKVYYSRALLIAALVWMKMPYFQWLAFVFIILALLEYQAKYPLEIGFSDQQILINALIKKRYTWLQFNNIVLKDGLLTLDFTNNKIMRHEIEDDEEGEADEEEFNAWCRQHLGKFEDLKIR